jgi:RNA polymerase sigma-70 factor, ECF subfamily
MEPFFSKSFGTKYEDAVMNAKHELDRSNEETLIRLASQGSMEAFNQLVLIYQNMAYNHAYALLGDPALSDDATQESFIKAFQNMGGFRGGAFSFRAWLLKIVTNSAYDVLRRSQRHPTEPLFPVDENGEEVESPVWLGDPSASVQEIVEQKETAKHIYQMLDELPGVFRSVITLIDIYELDYTEAATILNVPLGTVKSRLARARMQMKDKLQGSLEHARNYDMINARASL